MKWSVLLTLTAVILLATTASAVKLEYNRFFPECSFYDKELTATSAFRCGCYFFVPNAHLEAGYDLVVLSFGDGLFLLLHNELNYTVQFFDFMNPITIYEKAAAGQLPDYLGQFITTDFWWNRVQLLWSMTLAPFSLIFDVGSGVIAYILLIMFEFVKTYLFWIVLPVGSVNLMFYCISVLMSMKYTFKGGGVLFNPVTVGLIIALAIMAGSILMITLDISIFNIRFI